MRAVDGIGLTDLETDAALTPGGQLRARRGTRRRGGGPGRIRDPRWFPLAARVGTAAGEAYQAAADPAGAFEFGLARVLDGIEVLVRQRSAG